MLSLPTASRGSRFSGSIEPNRSRYDPCFRNFVEKPAYGPKRMDTFPSTWRVSRCGTDIGGDPTEAFPYTFALCREDTFASSQRSQIPLTGNPAYPLPSGIPDFCNKGSDPPPAPMKTNFVSMSVVSPVI